MTALSDALIIGAGPAGLMAAEELARAGHSVQVAEAKPSVGRKFLMAGKSGLNLTKDEASEEFLAAYGEARGSLRPMLDAFGPQDVQDWARTLGQEVFTGSSGRVFPKVMKASPLLRAWMTRLGDLGVQVNTRWRWTGFDDAGFAFDTPDGTQTVTPDVTVLALGGASWARLGSDGAWAPWLACKGVALTPFQGANVGLRVAWSEHMARHYGAPVKGISLSAGQVSTQGEFVISAQGLEGGAIYTLSKPLREGAALCVDLLPKRSLQEIETQLARPRGKTTLANQLRKMLKLDPVKLALLQEFGRPLPEGKALAKLLKSLPLPHQGARPMDQAISTAGGVAWQALSDGLMLKPLPGVFVAGEMIDWEAPTGGYLLTACLATGRWAGQHAARYLAEMRQTRA